MSMVRFVTKLRGAEASLPADALERLERWYEMPWIKFDDRVCLNPKVIGVGSAAAFLWFRAICYSNLYMLDGRVPKAIIDLFATEDRDYAGDPNALVGRLVEAGLFHRDGDQFIIHDYGDYQWSKEKILAERKKRDQRNKRGGQQRAATGERDGSGRFTSDAPYILKKKG